MKINYKTFNDEAFDYFLFNNSIVSLNDIGWLANQYVHLTREIPDKVYMSLKVYESFTDKLTIPPTIVQFSSEKLYMTVFVKGIGLVQIIPVIDDNEDFIMVGQSKDYDLYKIDTIFEEKVLT